MPNDKELDKYVFISKNFTLTNEHYRFFKECLPAKAGSMFFRELVDNSDMFKAWNKSSPKDTTKYRFNGKTHFKNRLVLAVVKAYVEDTPKVTFDKLKKVFPDSLQGSYGVFDTFASARKKYNKSLSNQWRYFHKRGEPIKLSDSKIVVCTEWTITNINGFIYRAEELGFEIEKEVETVKDFSLEAYRFGKLLETKEVIKTCSLCYMEYKNPDFWHYLDDDELPELCKDCVIGFESDVVHIERFK